MLRFGFYLAAVSAVVATSPARAAGTQSIRCTAAGAKFFAPAMTAEAICTRFVATLAKRARIRLGPASDAAAIFVDLRFQPNGLASAKAVRHLDGRTRSWPLQELAVSDRRFSGNDLDILAANVARVLAAPGLTADVPKAGKG